MKRKFYYHPDRQKEVNGLIMTGVVRAEAAKPCAYMPLVDGDDKPVVGWWVEEWEMSDWSLFPPPAVPQEAFDYTAIAAELRADDVWCRMNRRNFLRMLAGAAAAPAVTHFLPPIGGWHSDVIVDPVLGYNQRFDASMRLIDDYFRRAEIGRVFHSRMYFLGAAGVFKNGVLISKALDPEEFSPWK